MKPSNAFLAAIGTAIFCASTPAEGSVSILSTNVLNPTDASGVGIADGTLGIVVVDTGNNGFGSLTAGGIALNSFIGDDDDYIIGRLTSMTVFGKVSLQIEVANLSVTESSPLSNGDSFTLLWLPGLTIADDQVASGQTYGEARSSNWILPADGNDVTGDLVSDAGQAGKTVAGGDSSDPYTDWLALHFTAAERANSLVGGPDSDPDGDGHGNLLEFVLGGKPRDSSDIGSIEGGFYEIGGEIYLGYVVPLSVASNVIVEGECSSNCTTWLPAADPVAFDSSRVLIRDTVPFTDADRRFLRVRAYFQPAA